MNFTAIHLAAGLVTTTASKINNTCIMSISNTCLIMRKTVTTSIEQLKWINYYTYCEKPVDKNRLFARQSFRRSEPLMARGVHCFKISC